MNYMDIKKYGKNIDVDGKPFIQAFDYLVDCVVRNRLCNKARARTSTIYYIEKGLYGGQMFLAMENVRTLKTLEAID